MNTAISIVIPVYNSMDYLHKALDSCINQTLDNIEIICVDDMSTDDSWKIICDYEKRHPDKIVKIRLNEKGGQGGARNAGVQIAKSEYICFLDSDDYLDIHLCEDAYNALKREAADLVYFDYFRVEGENIYPVELISEEDIPYWYHNAGCAVWLQIIKRSILVDNKLLSPTVIRAADDAITPLWKFYAKKKIKLGKPYYYYVYRENSLVNNTSFEKIVAPITGVIPYRNRLFAEKGIINNFKAEIDALIAFDIVSTLKRALRLGYKLDAKRMISLREASGIPDNYFLDETKVDYCISAIEKEIVHKFINCPEEIEELVPNINVYLKYSYELGYSVKVNELLLGKIHQWGVNTKKVIAIWGANENGVALLSTFNRIGIDAFLFDNQKKKIEIGINNILHIYDFDDLEEMDIDYVFISTQVYYKQIEKQINNMPKRIKIINAIDFVRHAIEG